MSARAQAIVLLGWGVAVAGQLGWLPGLRYAWAVNLWAYQPVAARAALLLLSFAACWPVVRQRGLAAFAALARAAGALPSRLHAPARLLAVVLGLWLLRERELFGDSRLLFTWARGAEAFVFPDMGATWLLRQVVWLGPTLGLRSAPAVALLVCLCGGLAFELLRRLAAELAPPRRPEAAAWILALLATGGWIRIFAGHFEVYAPLVVAVLAYLVLALEVLRGRRPLWTAALALGLCGWVHAVSVLLVPGHVWLVLRRGEGLGGAARRLALGAAVALAPPVLFALGCLAFGAADELGAALAKALQVLGRDPDPAATRWWVRGWGGAPSVGTDVVFLSAAHWKYVANAAWLLMPFALPGALLLALRRRGGPAPDARARLLLFATAPFVAYAFALRPFWGPWDWDLFSLAALGGGAWLAHRLAAVLPPGELRAWASLLVALQLLFVTAPFLAVGIAAAHDAGPFAPALFELRTARPMTPPGPRLAPWL